MSLAEKFWCRVDKSGECWVWTGCKTSKGYGQVRLDGRNLYAHRVAITLAGVDPTGMQVDHICRNASCVRPEHLRLATPKQNSENLSGPYANSKSGVRGVWWDKRAKSWQAGVGHHGVQHRRRFKDLAEAERWVIAKRLELFTHNETDHA